MTTSKRWLNLTAAALLACGAAFPTLTASAAPGRLRAALTEGPLRARLGDKLGLNAAQKAQIKAILHADKETLKTLIGQMREARTALREVIRMDTASEADIRAASAAVAAVEADLAVERHKLAIQIKPVLTAEQLARLAAMQQRLDELTIGAIERIGLRLDGAE